jgi:hypothetical protein
VIFLNGYESDCGSASFKGAFGIADQVLQANGQVSLFFNYCTVPGQPTIEDMGAAFGAFLSGLRYEDGQPVDLVDSVAHSMGGLIVRSYLSGKGSTAGVFNPPAVTHLRKIVFVATPHFGTGVTTGLPFSNAQLDQLTSGSCFLFDLTMPRPSPQRVTHMLLRTVRFLVATTWNFSSPAWEQRRRSPGFPGLDQMNCVIPSGLSGDDTAPLTVTSGTRTSNIVTIVSRSDTGLLFDDTRSHDRISLREGTRSNFPG